MVLETQYPTVVGIGSQVLLDRVGKIMTALPGQYPLLKAVLMLINTKGPVGYRVSGPLGCRVTLAIWPYVSNGVPIATAF